MPPGHKGPLHLAECLLPPLLLLCSTDLCPSIHPREQDYLTHDYTSNSPSSKEAIDALRNATLQFFGADPAEYLVRGEGGGVERIGGRDLFLGLWGGHSYLTSPVLS